MKKKFKLSGVFFTIFCVAAVWSFTGCAAFNGENRGVTYEQVEALKANHAWQTMSPEDFTIFFGVEGIEDQNAAAIWGDDVKIYQWFGKDDIGKVEIYFRDMENNGKYVPVEMKPSADLK